MLLPPELDKRQRALGLRLRRFREQSSLRRLAEVTGINKQTLISVEAGEDFRISTLLKLLEAQGRLPEFDRFVASLTLAGEVEFAPKC